jgi:hypothetical protein
LSLQIRTFARLIDAQRCFLLRANVGLAPPQARAGTAKDFALSFPKAD